MVKIGEYEKLCNEIDVVLKYDDNSRYLVQAKLKKYESSLSNNAKLLNYIKKLDTEKDLVEKTLRTVENPCRYLELSQVYKTLRKIIIELEEVSNN